MTLPEIALWHALRTRPGGFKFRRQHPAGPYSLDFYCDAARLCVEVDGEVHERGDNPARDALRDMWLARRGVETLRIAARDVLSNPEGVTTMIVVTAAERAVVPAITPGAMRRRPSRGGLS